MTSCRACCLASLVCAACFAATLHAQESEQPVLERLDPQTKVKVLATFAGLVILGIGMMLLAWLGARVTRRYMRGGKPIGIQPVRPADDDWVRPLTSHDGAPSSDDEQA